MKAAVISAQGLGDGLISMVASHQLMNAGYEVVTYNDHLPELRNWFPGQSLRSQPSVDDDLSDYDLIILQYDHSKKAHMLIDKYRDILTVLYPSYQSGKFPLFTKRDFAMDSKKPIVCEVAKAMHSLFNLSYSIDNGLTVPQDLDIERIPHRIAIHPTSSTPLRTWNLQKFIAVGKWLLKKGYSPVFCLSPHEKATLQPLFPEWVDFPIIRTLEDTAKLIAGSQFVIGNESGLVHLASNLDIPFLVIAGNEKRIRQWQPGWRIGKIVTPPSWIPNIKCFRFREKYWQRCIPTSSVIRLFSKAISENH